MELYDKKYVYFEWDDKLEGKKGFASDTIGVLKDYVENGMYACFGEICKNPSNGQLAYPFGIINYSGSSDRFQFCYYDPNYEVKKAYNEGKKLQWKYRYEENWKDWDSEECPEFRDDTCGYELRVKPEDEDIDYDTGVIDNEVLDRPLTEEPEENHGNDIKTKTDKMREKLNKKWNEIISENYISFSIARYALTDVLEELHKSNAKDIIVTKQDDNLVVKYKPYWMLGR